MPIVIKNLVTMKLPGATGTVYSAPTSPARAAVVTSVRIVNRSTTTAVTVNLYAASPVGGTAYCIVPAGLVLQPKAVFIDDAEISLASGDGITGDASLASTVDIVLSGFERDVV